MKKTKKFTLFITLIFTLSMFPFNVFAKDAKPQRFCTMDTAVQQMLDVAQIPKDLQEEPVVRLIASNIVAEKLADSPGGLVKIVWKDIYDLRGTVNAWLVQNGHPWNRIGQAIDAVGSALTGTFIGKFIMVNSLILAGPVGFIMLGGMNIVQETFQCNPSGVVMAINAGATVVVLIPWCKIPGINKGCVAVTGKIGLGVEKVANGMFHKNLSAAVLKTTTAGVVVALKLKAQDCTITAMEIINYFDGKKSFRNTRFEFDDREISTDETLSTSSNFIDMNTFTNNAQSISLNDSELSLEGNQSINFDAMQNELIWN